MSLYNMLMGVNENAGIFLKVLGFSHHDIPRFRDCWVENNSIVIYTRTGGGNRAYYESRQSCFDHYPEYFTTNEHPSGPWNCDLRKNPYYISDTDCTYDATYALFYFRFPEEFEAELKEYATANPSLTVEAKWEMIFEAMRASAKEKSNDAS